MEGLYTEEYGSAVGGKNIWHINCTAEQEQLCQERFCNLFMVYNFITLFGKTAFFHVFIQ